MSDLLQLPAPAPRWPVPSRRQLIDAVVAVLLVFGQFVLLLTTVTFLGLMVMSTDACAYQACGDPVWLNRAIWLGAAGGVVLLLATAVFTLLRIVRHRAAWFVPLIGCAAQLVLGVGCWALEMQAGPLVH